MTTTGEGSSGPRPKVPLSNAERQRLDRERKAARLRELEEQLTVALAAQAKAERERDQEAAARAAAEKRATEAEAGLADIPPSRAWARSKITSLREENGLLKKANKQLERDLRSVLDGQLSHLPTDRQEVARERNRWIDAYNEVVDLYRRLKAEYDKLLAATRPVTSVGFTAGAMEDRAIQSIENRVVRAAAEEKAQSRRRAEAFIVSGRRRLPPGERLKVEAMFDRLLYGTQTEQDRARKGLLGWLAHFRLTIRDLIFG